ncbi:hypothetical protein CesoFtcFv8_020047 [Champsocephalus esox]|uniref:Uncharacterized protein n=1 Tax=Champsocephalus esox TaxID=159716 RepID=A0AAN8BEQ0_9TELE|nr:hypothetical protein CesoFtcFv8_020047 [Champsocephalus esox]
MQTRPEKFGSLSSPASSSQRGLFRKSTTYLAKIAVTLQDAPGTMLTFTQLMDRLAPLIPDGIVTIENNISLFIKQQMFCQDSRCPRSHKEELLETGLWSDHSKDGASSLQRNPAALPRVGLQSGNGEPEQSIEELLSWGSTHCGLAAKPIRMHVCTESSFPLYTRARAAPYFSSPHSSDITYSVPTFTQDALGFYP